MNYLFIDNFRMINIWELLSMFIMYLYLVKIVFVMGDENVKYYCNIVNILKKREKRLIIFC